MLSTDLANVIAAITNSQSDMQYHLTKAYNYHAEEGRAKKLAEDEEKLAKEIELKIDKLQLDLRRVMNGEASTVPVEAVKTPDMQIGREG